MVFSVPYVALHAQSSIPDAEALAPPTLARLSLIQQAAQHDGWRSQSAELQSAARRALARDKLSAAAAWFHIYQWSVLLSRTDKEFIPPVWIDPAKRTNASPNPLASRSLIQPAPLADFMTPECQAWVLCHTEFSEEFFSLLEPVDYFPKVLKILSDLHHHDAVQFEAYANLALAIAVVYDVPPPPYWPHAQIPPAVLAHRWPDTVATFDWFAKQDRAGRTFHSLGRLRADELKFVVDVAAHFAELEWAQKAVNLPLAELERAYGMIRYQEDRTVREKMIWAGKDYVLSTILATGGICVDQAYFAYEVGKARGVPTLFFHGVGEDGRHAWFGFLGNNQEWHLNAGRYAQQRFVTGFVHDPQTWREISDHELKFLSERTRASRSFRQSHVLTEFAGDFLEGGDAVSAAVAARKAVNFERRNPNAWEILIEAEKALKREPKQIEGTLREAIIAFLRDPDLEAYYSKRVSDSLRARGETSAADFEQRRIAKKYQLDRADLSLRQAREAMWRTTDGEAGVQLIRNYNATVDRLGPGAGIAFFDEIVLPVLEYLAQRKKIEEAERAVERARRTLHVVPKSQLAQEFAAVSEKLKTLR